MKYIIVICALSVIITCIFFIKNKQKVYKSDLNGDMLLVKNKKQKALINVEQLPAEINLNEKELIEINDKKTLARINNLVPGLLQAGIAARTASQTQGKVLYQAIIPVGEELSKSKYMNGAFRGFYHGSNGRIKGHANLVETNQKNLAIANKVSATMGVASMVVGQYYMTQINAELSEINKGIEKISNFQDNEYKSKVFALLAQTKKIASFKVEILENQESRISELNILNNLEQECIELLGQANITISDYTKIKDFNYEEYEKELSTVHNWYIYQQILLDVLYKISDLRYTLNLGKVSMQQCGALINTYKKQVEDTQMKLSNWHEENIKHFGIDTSQKRRRKTGIDAKVSSIIGVFSDDFNYRDISKNTADMITMQSICLDSLHKPYKTDLYNKDVRLISKDGKMYYLPNNENNQIK